MVESQPSKLLVAGSIPVSRSRDRKQAQTLGTKAADQKVVETTFRQSGIPIEKVAEFEELSAGIQRVFSPAAIERFFRKLESKGIRIRQFETVLDKKVLEGFDPRLRQKGARKLYEALSVADQAQIRELYLRSLEQVDDALRTRFYKIYVMY